MTKKTKTAISPDLWPSKGRRTNAQPGTLQARGTGRAPGWGGAAHLYQTQSDPQLGVSAKFASEYFNMHICHLFDAIEKN